MSFARSGTRSDAAANSADLAVVADPVFVMTYFFRQDPVFRQAERRVFIQYGLCALAGVIEYETVLC